MIKSAVKNYGETSSIAVSTDSQDNTDCTNLGNELTIPCLSQQPHNHMHTYIAHALHITYSMAYFKMAYQIHVHRPIRRWSIFINSTSTTSMEHTTRYVKKMIVVTTGGEYCNFHRVNSRGISSQVSQTNTTQMFSLFS